jgi:hypothetical protein
MDKDKSDFHKDEVLAETVTLFFSSLHFLCYLVQAQGTFDEYLSESISPSVCGEGLMEPLHCVPAPGSCLSMTWETAGPFSSLF